MSTTIRSPCRRRRSLSDALCVILLLALASCATSVTRQQPISDNAAVVGWADEARILRDEKEYEQAAARLERALRIEPANAQLWHELAQVHFGQGNFRQAIQFAYKSDALTRDENLRLRNKRLISKARARLQKTEA